MHPIASLASFAAEFEPAVIGTRRRSPRAPVSLDARIGRGGLDRTLCRVVDLSIGGVRLQTYSALKRDTLIWLTLPGLPPKTTRVVWGTDYEAGCEFIEPLDQASFDRLATS